VIIIITTAITAPILNHFNSINYKLSNDISHWGAFGDYIGGLLNPIISLCSLFLLAKVSVQIARMGSDQNKALFIYEQRNKIYQEFIHHYQSLLNSYSNLTEVRAISIKESQNGRTSIHTILYQKKSDIYEIQKSIKNSIDYFTLFEGKYGHFYKDYDFQSKKHISFLKNLEDFDKSFIDIHLGIIEKQSSAILDKKIENFKNIAIISTKLIDNIGKYLASKIS